MFPRVLIALAMLSLVVPAPAHAQFGGMFGAKRKPADAKAPTSGCDPAKPKSAGSRIMGSVLGSVAGNVIGRTGIGRFLPIPSVSGILTEAFACRLEPKEQQQAADATVAATRGGAVGATSAWTSDTRPGVTGSSTIAAKEQLADGSTCMTVRDVAFVNGEETTVSKRMCRARGASGYMLAA